jgi:hypothetical protein
MELAMRGGWPRPIRFACAGAARCTATPSRARRRATTLGIAAVLAWLAQPLSWAATAGVSVEFVAPERYADIGRLQAERQRTLEGLRAVFESLGAAHLPSGQSLRIEVLNVDLAGELLPSTRTPGTDIRTRRSSSPARIAFRWTLSEDGRVVAAGEERLSGTDTAYQSERDPQASLGFERGLLEQWFDDRFGRPRGATASRP